MKSTGWRRCGVLTSPKRASVAITMRLPALIPWMSTLTASRNRRTYARQRLRSKCWLDVRNDPKWSLAPVSGCFQKVVANL
jgi:hypothetical protein